MMTTITNNYLRALAMLVATLAVLAAASLSTAARPADASETYHVNTASDEHAVCNDVLCSLRGAILEAEDNPGHDAIHFNVDGGPGLKIFPIESSLPKITDPLTINGYTQPGASQNTQPSGTDAQPMIVLNGSQAGDDTDGLRLRAGGSGSVIKGLNIQQFDGNGIDLFGNVSGVTIAGNFIGTNPFGTADNGNGGFGINILETSGHIIGGPSPFERNLISGNDAGGIRIWDTQGNTVEGNLIGTDENGTADLGNGSHGVSLLGTHDNVARNNTIAFNDGDGVTITNSGGAAYGNEVSRNSMFSNKGHGIDLGNDGFTPNDPGDTDAGPNGSQNSPLISSATNFGGKTTIEGTINTDPNHQVVVEFFSNPVAFFPSPGSGVYEGKSYLGEKTLLTDGSGNASFTFEPSQQLSEGRIVTATATEYGPNSAGPGNTSEFSGGRTVVVPDTVAPKVLSTVPKTNATGVSPAANVKAAFSENMLDSSVNNKTFKLRKQGSTAIVSATIGYDAQGKRATLDPSAKLKRGATYVATVTPGVKDLAGNSLDQKPKLADNQAKVWKFTVRQ